MNLTEMYTQERREGGEYKEKSKEVQIFTKKADMKTKQKLKCALICTTSGTCTRYGEI